MFNTTTNENTTDTTRPEVQAEPGTGQDWDVLAKKAIELRNKGNAWSAVAVIMNDLGFRTITGKKMRTGTLQAQVNRMAKTHGLSVPRVRVNDSGTVSKMTARPPTTYRRTPERTGTRMATMVTYVPGTTPVPVTFIKTVLNDNTLTDATKVDFLRKLIA